MTYKSRVKTQSLWILTPSNFTLFRQINMSIMENTKLTFTMAGRILNEVISFFVFTVLDVLDFLLCYTYRVIDFIVEAEWKSCYCSSVKQAITSSGTIMVSDTKIVCLTSSSSSRNKLQLEEISDTLYTRSSLVSEVSKYTVNELKRLKLENAPTLKRGTLRSTFTVNSTIVEMLQGKIGGQKSHSIPRWSDCDCKTCNSWTASCKDSLFVHVDGAKGMYDK